MSYFKKLYLSLTEFSWISGIMGFDEPIISGNQGRPDIRWIKGGQRKSWFADPFILSVNGDKIDILVEEYEYRKRKGRISKITVDRKTGRVCEVKPVLDGNLHFSFPYWFTDNGKTYICPENVRSGKLQLYEYDPETYECSLKGTLNPYPLADAIFAEVEGRKCILATRYPRDNGNVLEVFPFYDGECPEEVQPTQTIVFADKSARNGGRIFRIGEKLIRPAQNSNHFYGESIVFQEMKIENGMLSFDEIKRISSPNRKYPLSFHTFNLYENGLVAVDAQGFRYGWLGLVLYRIREHFRK